jgi:hypothetical protein
MILFVFMFMNFYVQKTKKYREPIRVNQFAVRRHFSELCNYGLNPIIFIVKTSTNNGCLLRERRSVILNVGRCGGVNGVWGCGVGDDRGMVDEWWQW